ncbi:uncharacterized protein LOC141595043 [Silene latifolia]|uniref:uncharacterized protein LOC141595043 n=1 Tax=Silene latifolia TaxID=37657 RepID=UPI003D78A031
MVDFETGLRFTDKKEFIDAVQNYKILNGYAIKTYKSDKNRIGAHCTGKWCKWRVWASWKCGEKTFQIKSVPSPHTCLPFDFNEKSRLVTSRWLCKRYFEKLRVCPSWKLKEFRDYVKADINIEPTMTLCMRAKQEALNLIVGDYKEQFGKLRDYAFELLRTNKGSTFKIETDKATPDGPSVFNGIYVCLDSLKKDMLESYRKVICVDGCILKGTWNGQILVAVGRDANNQMYPFA